MSAGPQSTLSLLLHDHVWTTGPDIHLYWEVWDSGRKIDWMEWRYRDKVVLIIDEALLICWGICIPTVEALLLDVCTVAL